MNVWCYGLEKEALWRTIVDRKYGSGWGRWISGVLHEPHGVSLWKHIRSGWEIFSRFIKFEVGNDRCIRFWHDLWCGDVILRRRFLNFFAYAGLKKPMLCSKGINGKEKIIELKLEQSNINF